MTTKITLPDGTERELIDEMVERLRNAEIVACIDDCPFDEIKVLCQYVFPNSAEALSEEIVSFYSYMKAVLSAEGSCFLVSSTDLPAYPISAFFADPKAAEPKMQ